MHYTRLGYHPGHVIRTFALIELRMATTGFKIRIGIGATSFVYLVELGDGRFGVVKRVMEERGGSKKIFLDEVSALLRLSHPNLVALLGFCYEKVRPKKEPHPLFCPNCLLNFMAYSDMQHRPSANILCFIHISIVAHPLYVLCITLPNKLFALVT